MNNPAVESHACYAEGCTRMVSAKLLMCPQHWYKVPGRIKRRVWDLDRLGQESLENPSPEYARALRDAIEAVARLEGRRDVD